MADNTALLNSLRVWLPELMLSVGALAVILAGVFVRRRSVVAFLTFATLAGSAWALLLPGGAAPGVGFFGQVVADPLTQIIRWIALGTVALTSLMVLAGGETPRQWWGEYLGLLLLVGVALMLVAAATHVVTAIVALEFVSLSAYALVALKRDARASEAAIKYLLFGAMSSGIMLFGFSLFFSVTPDLSFEAIRQAVLRASVAQQQALAVAVLLVLAGVGFKISMVPFHLWTPDVYEGASIPVTAMLSVGPKAAGLALMLRLAEAFGPVWQAVLPVVAVLTILTMTLGNAVALVQTNVKRLLAYSTIGQVGYLLIGVVTAGQSGEPSMLVYLLAYLFMNLGAFACVAAVHAATGSESLDAFRGLSQRAPVLALSCTVFLLSLAGIPPLFGFIGKFLLFGAAIHAQLVGLAIAGILNSAVALYYYVNIIRLMYLQPAIDAKPVVFGLPLHLAVGLCGVATVVLGVFPGAVLWWVAGPS